MQWIFSWHRCRYSYKEYSSRISAEVFPQWHEAQEAAPQRWAIDTLSSSAVETGGDFYTVIFSPVGNIASFLQIIKPQFFWLSPSETFLFNRADLALISYQHLHFKHLSDRHIMPYTPHGIPQVRTYDYPHFSHAGTKAQRSWVTCPRSHIC